MDISPPRQEEAAGVVVGVAGGAVASGEGPSPAPSGCFPRLFARKKKGKRKVGGGNGSKWQQWRGERRGLSRSTPSNSPPPKLAAAEDSSANPPPGATPPGTGISNNKHSSTTTVSTVCSQDSSSSVVTADNHNNNSVAFKSPVIIQQQQQPPPPLPKPDIRDTPESGTVSRQASIEPSGPPALGMNRSSSMGALWGGISLSRGMSIEDMPVNIFGGKSKRSMSRTMSRRMSLEELIIPEDFRHVDTPDGPSLPSRLVPMISNGLARIALHAKAQQMTPKTWEVCLSFLRPDEVARVRRYKFDKDRRLALGSILLQRALIHWTFGIPYDDVVIKRTEKGKPFFLIPDTVHNAFENWNFNVSHHGEFVAIASEPALIVGLDIMNSKERPRSRANSDEFFKVFRRQLSHQEWGSIYEAPSEDARLERFYRQWALKEAFIKAIGSGLTMSPRRIEIVNLDNTPRPNSDKPYDPGDLRIDGRSRPNWRFKFHQLDHAHVACLSRGPPSDAIPEYRETLKVQDMTSSPLRYGLESIQPEFESVSLRELIPACKLADYDATMPVRSPDSPVFRAEEVVTTVAATMEEAPPGVPSSTSEAPPTAAPSSPPQPAATA